jgi:C4-dicarboxylate transporter, DctQ subunit
MHLLSRTGHLLDHLIIWFAWLAGFIMMLSLLAVCTDVVMRYFFNRPIPGVLQFTEYSLLYIPFLAAAYVLKEDGHIKVDIVLDRLNRKVQSLINMATSILSSVVLLVLTYYGAYISWDYYRRQVPTLEYFKIPEFLVIMIVPVGCFFFSVQFIRKAYDNYKSHGLDQMIE